MIDALANLPAPDWADEKFGVYLYNGDCVPLLAAMPDKSVDAVVTDPPYGVGFSEWDDARPPDSFFDEIRRIAPSCAVHAPQGEIWGWPRPDWIMAWFMPGSVMKTNGGNFRHWEPVLVYGKEKAIVDSKVFPPIGAARNGHPCPKPDRIVEWLVGAFVGPDEIVIDPLMGSGSTGVAAIKMGRRFIGIELDPGYFQICVDRIKAAIVEKQGGPLFARHEPGEVSLFA